MIRKDNSPTRSGDDRQREIVRSVLNTATERKPRDLEHLTTPQLKQALRDVNKLATEILFLLFTRMEQIIAAPGHKRGKD